MKKLIFILVASIACFASSSCIIEDGDTRPRATAAGKLIYDNTEQVISKNIVFADIALKLNAYIFAPSDLKISIEDKFFPKYKPRNTGNNWVLVNSPYSFATDGKSLDVIGSKWTVTQNQAGSWIDSEYGVLIVTIECIGDKQWKITSKDAYTYESVSNSDLVAKATAPSNTNTYILYDYTITGAGKSLSNESYSGSKSLQVEYTIKNPMKFVIKNSAGYSEINYPGYSEINYNFTAVEGKVEMVVSNIEDPDKRDLIMADLSLSIGNSIINRITFNGVTEVW